MKGYEQFGDWWGERARMAWDALAMRPTRGMPSWMLHVMDMPLMEELTGHEPGDYARDPEHVYLAFQELAGACFIDQYIARNPLTMGSHGFAASAPRNATTGAEHDRPRRHRHRLARGRRRAPGAVRLPRAGAGDRELRSRRPGPHRQDDRRRVRRAAAVRPDILKGPYGGGFQSFPRFHYGHLRLRQLLHGLRPVPGGDGAGLRASRPTWPRCATAPPRGPSSRAACRRSSASTTTWPTRAARWCDIRSLDRIWFPHFARSIQPLLDAGVRLIWHCDGNLMADGARGCSRPASAASRASSTRTAWTTSGSAG